MKFLLLTWIYELYCSREYNRNERINSDSEKNFVSGLKNSNESDMLEVLMEL